MLGVVAGAAAVELLDGPSGKPSDKLAWDVGDGDGGDVVGNADRRELVAGISRVAVPTKRSNFAA